MRNQIRLTITGFILVIAAAGCAIVVHAEDGGSLTIPEWTKTPPAYADEMVKKLEEEGYNAVLSSDSTNRMYRAQLFDPDDEGGFGGLVSATRNVGGKTRAMLVYYFLTNENAKAQFNAYRQLHSVMAAAGEINGLVSNSDTISYRDKAGASYYYRLSGNVLFYENDAEAAGAMKAMDFDTMAFMENLGAFMNNKAMAQESSSRTAASVHTPPVAVLSKLDIDNLLKNSKEIRKLIQEYEDKLGTDLYGWNKVHGDDLTSLFMEIRNTSVPADLRLKLSKFGMGDNAFEKIAVIIYGAYAVIAQGGIFNMGDAAEKELYDQVAYMYEKTYHESLPSEMPEDGSAEMELYRAVAPMFGGYPLLVENIHKSLLGDYESAIHKDDLALIHSRIDELRAEIFEAENETETVSEKSQPQRQKAWTTLAPETPIKVITTSEISTKTIKTGDEFTMQLSEDIVNQGRVIARRGSPVKGVISESDPDGRINGAAMISLTLTELTLADGLIGLPVTEDYLERLASVNGSEVKITTNEYLVVAYNPAAKMLGAVSELITAISGKGNTTAVGTGGVAPPDGTPAVVKPGTMITFNLDAPLLIFYEKPEFPDQAVQQ